METGLKITCTETCKIKELVKYFYEAESTQWHKNTHKNGGTMQENCDDTTRCISQGEIVYQIRYGEKLVAFFTRFENENGPIILNSFHILKEYRVRWFIKKFWQLVDERLGSEYATGICTKNTSAILHLVRNGFVITNEIEDSGKKFIILTKNCKSHVC